MDVQRKFSNTLIIIVSIVILLLAILMKLPYGYYTILRFVLCGTSIYLAFNAQEFNKKQWVWVMGIIALLFNPIIPVKLDKATWTIIDIVTIVIFTIYFLISREVNIKINKRLYKKIFIVIGLVSILLVVVSIWSNYEFQVRGYPINLVTKANYYPKAWVENVKGDITIYGWNVKRVKDKPNTYLVSYTYSTPTNIVHGWWWEVNTKEEIVKKVTGDGELEKKYGLLSMDETPKKPPEAVSSEGVIVGEVVSVNIDAMNINIKTDVGEKIFYVIAGESIVWKGINDARLSDINVGDEVEIGYYTDDNANFIASWVDCASSATSGHKGL